jgi:hypothetical protein
MKRFILLCLSHVVFAIFFMIAISMFGYLYQSNSGSLSDKTLLNIAEADVLGKPLYEGTCPRVLYKKEVEYPYGKDGKGAAIFLFKPLPEHVQRCPPVEVTMSRYTGEAWLTFK